MLQNTINMCWRRWFEFIKAGDMAGAVRERQRIASLEKIHKSTRESRHAMRSTLACLRTT